jgi:hypothetical protein
MAQIELELLAEAWTNVDALALTGAFLVGADKQVGALAVIGLAVLIRSG